MVSARRGQEADQTNEGLRETTPRVTGPQAGEGKRPRASLTLSFFRGLMVSGSASAVEPTAANGCWESFREICQTFPECYRVNQSANRQIESTRQGQLPERPAKNRSLAQRETGFEVNSRGGRIRTYGLVVPNDARYRAALHPEK